MSSSLPRTIFISVAGATTGWYRCSLPAMALGVEWAGMMGEPPALRFPTGVTESGLRFEDLFGYDVVVVQQPAARGWVDAIRALQAAGVRVLFEIDDYVHGVRKATDHDFSGHYGRDVVEAYERNMGIADGIVCSTEYLAGRYRAFNKRVWVCRNGLDLKRYALSRPRRDVVGIGWAGGTGHREAMQAWLPAVTDVMREFSATRFVTVGQPFAADVARELGADRGLVLPFSPLDTYPASMTHFDVALAPAGRGAFYQGKSDLRWLEASALGIPVIADPRVYPEIEHGVTGFHADGPDEVREHLRRLVADPQLRHRVGGAARAHVAEHRSIGAMAGQWAQAIEEAAGRTALLA